MRVRNPTRRRSTTAATVASSRAAAALMRAAPAFIVVWNWTVPITSSRRRRTARGSVLVGLGGDLEARTMAWTIGSKSLTSIFGLAGLAGALAAGRAGRLHHRGRSLPATGAAWVKAAAFTHVVFAGRSALLVVCVTVLLDGAVQAVNMLNRSRVLTIAQEARILANTLWWSATSWAAPPVPQPPPACGRRG
ncbi:hypothetical protein ACF06Q_08155 [Streptomyces leeuwenhoekii]|uniref:hypothetical protein n=1 Tax=Streptomyces leeuwenhoekii TaxID=1437453 RepID=UPI0036FFD44E